LKKVAKNVLALLAGTPRQNRRLALNSILPYCQGKSNDLKFMVRVIGCVKILLQKFLSAIADLLSYPGSQQIFYDTQGFTVYGSLNFPL